MIELMLWLNLLLFSRCIKSHTVKVCNVVSADGRTVELYAGTYHSFAERNIVGGIIVGGVRYDFTDYEDDNGPVNEFPPSCSAGKSCDCSTCPTYTYNGIRYWHKVTVTNLVDGDYDVSTSCDTAVECPWCQNQWSFTVTGSNPCDYYLYFDDGVERTQAEAQAQCEALGSNLATITTEDELECALLAVGEGSSPWVGLYSENDIGFFQYVDGSACPTPENGKYSGACTGKFGWIDGEPKCINDGYSHCVNLKNTNNGGAMDNDVQCEDTLTAYLCNNPDRAYEEIEYDITLNVCDVGHAGDRNNDDEYSLTITTDQGTSDSTQIPSDQLDRGQTVTMTAAGLGTNIESLSVISVDDDAICINGATVSVNGDIFSVSTDNLWISGNCANTLTLTPCSTSQIFTLSLESSAKTDIFSIDNILSDNNNNGKKWFGITDNTFMTMNIAVALLVFVFSVYQIYYCCLRKKDPNNDKFVETMDV